ncbi:MAG: molybdopterin-dependent oxidoreductase [Ilumatobacter sp.]|uniref:molybdopterin-dependent oxidoreductase n=1 Tax=Ilumatobacter sp. TaxID=1967498 RepID=UPI003C76BD1D
MKLQSLIPRRAHGLPPGQRVIQHFPRYSDKPLRWAPPIVPIELAITIDETPLATLDRSALERFEAVEQLSDFHCVTTWTYRGLRWTGVRLRDVLEAVVGGDLRSGAAIHAVAHAADGQSATFLTEDLLDDDVLLATELDDAPLDRRHGAPLRLVSPSQYGYKNVKHLTTIDFRRTEPESTLGAKEHLRARVALEERHATLANWVVRVPYRMSIIPTAIAAERGLSSSPRDDV